MMPRHINPTLQSQVATAPYNFVPLPNRIFTVADGIEVNGKKIKPWEMHDQFVPGTYSGWIDLTIKTLTPLFIRGATIQDEHGSWDTRDARLRPEPYRTQDGTPAIPGSSLRGMIRTLVEILSFSKIQPVTEAKPFFRTVANDRIGKAYRTRMIRSGRKPQGGILIISNGGVSISPREVVRVAQTKLPEGIRDRIGNGRDPNYTPPWPQQHSTCWVKLSHSSNSVDEISFAPNCPVGPSWRRGILVLTGNAPKKKREFVFLDPEGTTAQNNIVVPESIWERFHDEDQITQWQELAFPVDKPKPRCRKAAGYLRDGEPVFFHHG